MKGRIIIMGLLQIMVNWKAIKSNSDNLIEFFITPKDYKAVTNLNIFEKQSGLIVSKKDIHKNKESTISVKPKFLPEVLIVLNSYNITYKSSRYFYKIPGRKYQFYTYSVMPKNIQAVRLLNKMDLLGRCLLASIARINKKQLLRIHPQFKIEFERLIKQYNIDYLLIDFNDDYLEGQIEAPRMPDPKHFLEYSITAEDERAHCCLRYLVKIPYCNFDTIVRTTQGNCTTRMLRIHPEFKAHFENIIMKFNITYKTFDKLYKKPDINHFCVYSINYNRILRNFLKKLEKDGGCIIGTLPQLLDRNKSIINIHSEAKEQFEYQLKNIASNKFRLVSCFPKKPDYYNFRSYSINSATYEGTSAIIAFGKETGSFDFKSDTYKIQQPIIIKIHPHYKEDFENILTGYRTNYTLINYMPKEVDCNKYCAYLVSPQDQKHVEALKMFLIETNYVFWKNNEVSRQIEIMILRDFKIKFEELMRNLNIKYESLMDDVESNANT